MKRAYLDFGFTSTEVDGYLAISQISWLKFTDISADITPDPNDDDWCGPLHAQEDFINFSGSGSFRSYTECYTLIKYVNQSHKHIMGTFHLSCPRMNFFHTLSFCYKDEQVNAD
jgi:hypothetical protein